MAGYAVEIKNSEDMISFSTADAGDKPDITKVIFTMNTLDNSTRNKADSVRSELEISGTINAENRDRTKMLAKWSLDADRKTLYRDVEVVVYSSRNCTGDVLRRYQISNMFVIDYAETFDGDGDSGTFKLFIAQKEGNNKKEVFSS